MPVPTVAFAQGPPPRVCLLDQTLLPDEERVLEVSSVPELVQAIRRLVVRGAPAIGVAAAYGLLLGLEGAGELDAEGLTRRVRETADELARARPTAVNLFWALERMVERARRELAAGRTPAETVGALAEEASDIAAEDAEQCRRMGELGADLLTEGMTVLTHCNAGALATAGIGTALAPIYVAKERGTKIRVLADETRPLLQGARLTAWELARSGIEVTVIPDGAAAHAMRSGRVDAVLVGADRIARNGDVCNKIGTFSVAVSARHHGIPFYVVAPLSTFDPDAADGSAIPIEERSRAEVAGLGTQKSVPDEAAVWSPAFDVTPAELVSAIVTETGVIRSPDRAAVEEHLRRAGRLPPSSGS